MHGIAIGQKIHVQIKRGRRTNEIIEATVVEVKGRYVTCNYLGKNHKFYRVNGLQVSSAMYPDQLISDLTLYNEQLKNEEVYKKASRVFQLLARSGRQTVSQNINKLSVDEAKAFLYILNKIS